MWGSVGTLPYKVILGVRLIQTRHKISFWRIISLITLHNPGLYGNVPTLPHTAARPPQTGCPASTETGAADGHPTGQARPWGYLRPVCSVSGPSVQVIRVSGGRQNAIFAGFSGVASTHTKLHVKSEGGMGCTRVVQKSRGANPAVLGPAKRDLAPKTNPEGLGTSSATAY